MQRLGRISSGEAPSLGVKKLRADEIELRGTSPERNLWAAVFSRALRDCCNGDTQAKRWLLSDVDSGCLVIGTVLWVARTLGIERSLPELRAIIKREDPVELKNLNESLV